METLTQPILASRLTLNTLPTNFKKGVLVPPSHPITIIEVRAVRGAASSWPHSATLTFRPAALHGSPPMAVLGRGGH